MARGSPEFKSAQAKHCTKIAHSGRKDNKDYLEKTTCEIEAAANEGGSKDVWKAAIKKISSNAHSTPKSQL